MKTPASGGTGTDNSADNNKDDSTDNSGKIKYIYFSDRVKYLYVGENINVNYSVEPDDVKLLPIWKFSNSSMASVEDYVLTAKKVGYTNLSLSASNSEDSDSCLLCGEPAMMEVFVTNYKMNFDVFANNKYQSASNDLNLADYFELNEDYSTETKIRLKVTDKDNNVYSNNDYTMTIENNLAKTTLMYEKTEGDYQIYNLSFELNDLNGDNIDFYSKGFTNDISGSVVTFEFSDGSKVELVIYVDGLLT